IDMLAVWELGSGKVLSRFPNAGFVSQVAFAQSGRAIALLDGRGIRIHDLLTGESLAAYATPDFICEVTDRGGSSQTLVFAPDGRTLATGHRDGTIVLWKVPPPPERGANAIAEAEHEALWADLGSDAPGRARTAVERLARQPAVAMALLADRLR